MEASGDNSASILQCIKGGISNDQGTGWDNQYSGGVQQFGPTYNTPPVNDIPVPPSNTGNPGGTPPVPESPEGDASSTLYRLKATRIPIHPPGIDINKNIRQAQFINNLIKHVQPASAVNLEPLKYLWFANQVRPNGVWDYKQLNRNYENFGNFNYGATAAALNIPKGIALRAAGLIQIHTHTSDPSYGVPLFVPPFGDEPKDQVQINRGYNYGKIFITH